MLKESKLDFSLRIYIALGCNRIRASMIYSDIYLLSRINDATILVFCDRIL